MVSAFGDEVISAKLARVGAECETDDSGDVTIDYVRIGRGAFIPSARPPVVH